jgi:outer membrane protein TolC
MGTRSLVILVLVLAVLAAPARGDEIPMTLNECLERALEAALQIREGKYFAPIARTRVTEADSEFDHLLSFRASGGDSKRPSASFFAGADEVKEQTFSGAVELGQKIRTGGYYAFGIGANDLVTNNQFFLFRPEWGSSLTFRFEQPILRSGGLTYNETTTRLAEQDLTAAEADYRNVLETTLAEVERAYWTLVFVRRDRDVKVHSKGLAERLLEISRRRLENGAGTKVEVLQAVAGVAEREKLVILAEKAVRDGEDGLRSFLFPFPDDPAGEYRVVPTDAADAPTKETNEEIAERIRIAFEERPDVIAARARLEAAGIRVVRTENELLPRLDFFGSLAYAGLDDDVSNTYRELAHWDYPTWEIGLSLEIPLGNRVARSRHRRAVLERSRSVAGFESLKNRVIVDVRIAIRQVDAARKEIVATKKSTAAAEAQFEAEKDRVLADKATNYDLLEKEQDLSRARSDEILALTAYRAALVNLEAASGTYLRSKGILPPPSEPTEEKGE